eukprot:XP_001699440.1 predicted protein [Chlamydomonas reinhardtii]
MSGLDTRNADTAAWLVKVPVALAAVWKAACDQSMAGVVDDSGTEEGAGQLLGRIVTEGQWVLDSEYLKLVRSRTERAAEKVRVVGRYDGLDLDNQIAARVQERRLQKDIVERRKATEAAAKADQMKRPRLEREELEEILFRLFERHSAWAFKEVQAFATGATQRVADCRTLPPDEANIT